MKTYIDNQGILRLKSVVGSKLIAITADNWQDTHISYGNILVETDRTSIEINNDYRLVPYFGDVEELAGLNIRELSSSNEFDPSVMADQLRTEELNQTIKQIKVIRDIITLRFEAGKEEQHIRDHALIFVLENTKLILSEEYFFTPAVKLYIDKEIKNKIPSVENVKLDWLDDEDHGYQVNIDRQEIVL